MENTFGKGTGNGEHIFNAAKFSQPVLFDGIGKGKVRPTDFDAVIEIDNKYWFAFEVKVEGKDMPYGQSLSYTRTADRWNRCGDTGIVFLVEHTVHDPNKSILLKECKLKKYYSKGKWITAKKSITVTELLQQLKKHYKLDKI